MSEQKFDLLIIGAGIVGLATALEATRRSPGIRLAVLEKEDRVASHQTGHNSGVIHSGLYYRPGSVKARTCVTGRKALMEFCDRRSIPYEICGKIVVATSEDELPRLEGLRRSGIANGLEGIGMIGPERLREFEPHAHGRKPLHAPATGLIAHKNPAEAYANAGRPQARAICTAH